jgi:hypothetical protein
MSGEIEALDPACDLALARLLGQFSGAEALRALLCSLVSPLDEIEAAALAVHYDRWLDTATGAQLDVLGRIVREPRGGFEDVTYRRALRARVLINRSSGKLAELLAIALEFEPAAGPIEIREHAPNAITVRYGGTLSLSPAALVGRLQRARVGGVNLQLLYPVPGTLFTLSATASPAASASLGFGSTTEVTGGQLQGVVV